ncbi:hypothetical protein QQ045_027260 [Rhodiola kirilowii]
MNDKRCPTISGFIADRSTLPKSQRPSISTNSYTNLPTTAAATSLSSCFSLLSPNGIALTPLTAFLVISYFCKAGRVVDVEKVLNKMPLFGSIPDIDAWSDIEREEIDRAIALSLAEEEEKSALAEEEEKSALAEEEEKSALAHALGT